MCDYRLPSLPESDLELKLPEIVPEIDLDVPEVDIKLS